MSEEEKISPASMPVENAEVTTAIGAATESAEQFVPVQAEQSATSVPPVASASSATSMSPNDAPSPQEALPTIKIAYTAEMVTALTRFVIRGATVGSAISGGFFVLLGVLLSMMDDSYSGYFVLAGGLFFLLFLPILYAVVPLIAKRSPVVKWQVVTTLSFGDRIYGYEQSNVSTVHDVIYEWAIMVKAAEDKEYFFLFLTKQNAFAIRKADLKNCTVEGFRDLLKYNLGTRYKGK